MRTAKLKFYTYVVFGLCGLFFLVLAGSETLTHSRHFASNFLTALTLTITGLGLCLFSLTTIFIREDPDIWR